MAALENGAVPRKRIATYGKAARRRIPDYNFSSLAHRSQTPEAKQSEFLPSRSPSVAAIPEPKKPKNVARTPASRSASPASLAVAADIFDVPSSGDEAYPSPLPVPKATKKPTQTRVPKVAKDMLMVAKEDAESRKRVKLSPVRPAVQKPVPTNAISKPSPPRTKIQPTKQQLLESDLTSTVATRPKPTVQKKIAKPHTPRKLSPVHRAAPSLSTPPPPTSHADIMDLDNPSDYISPRGLQMWKDLLDPKDIEGDSNAEMAVITDGRKTSPPPARIGRNTVVKPAGVSKLSQRSPRKPPRRRLIDSLVEQATHDDDMGEDDSDSNESDPMEAIVPGLDFSNPAPRSQSLAPEVQISKALSSSQSQSQGSQVTGPKFTYSKQRSMLAEEDFLKQLELDMPSQPVQPTLGKPRRGSLPTLQKLPSFHEEDEDEDSAIGIRSVHELRQAGANNRFLDEIEDLLDRIGSPTPQPSSMRRSGLLDLASKIKDKNFTRQFRSNGVEARLFVHMGRETDLIAGFIMVSVLMALLAEANIMPHVVNQLRTQGIARLLIRLLESQTSVTLLAKDRKSNMSKVAGSLLSEHGDYLLKLPIWEELHPKTISPQTVALKCLELMVRQTREAGNAGDLISKELTTKLFLILKSGSDESSWDLPSGKEAVDFCLALSALESHSIAARTLHDENIWINDYLPIIADTLEVALTKPVDDFGVLQILILRLALNVTNNNPKASDVFARESLMAIMGRVIVSKFKKILRFLTEEDFSSAVDHLILVQGAMINFAEWSSAARESLHSLQGVYDDPLDNMVQLFVDNQESTSMVRFCRPHV